MPRKRGHGEGSIIERKSGARRFQAFFSVGDGKRISRCFYTRREARAWLHEMQRRKAEGENLEMRNVTLEEFLKHWLENIVRPSSRITTYEYYNTMCQKHIVPRLGRVRLSELRPQHLQALYGAFQEMPSLASALHRCMHQVLSWAMRMGIVSKNVADMVSSPKYHPKAMKALSESEVERLLLSARDAHDPYYPLWLLAVVTGMRRGELAGLHWEDVDLTRGLISVRHILRYTQQQGLILQEPKTAKGKRIIVISALAVQVLREHYQKEEEKKKQYPDSLALKMVFTNPKGGYLSPFSIDYHFQKALERAGLSPIRFHDLRHTSATLLLKYGVHPKIVQERLGHANISMTLDIYSHVIPSMQEEAALKIEGPFSQKLLNDCA